MGLTIRIPRAALQTLEFLGLSPRACIFLKLLKWFWGLAKFTQQRGKSVAAWRPGLKIWHCNLLRTSSRWGRPHWASAPYLQKKVWTRCTEVLSSSEMWSLKSSRAGAIIRTRRGGRLHLRIHTDGPGGSRRKELTRTLSPGGQEIAFPDKRKAHASVHKRKAQACVHTAWRGTQLSCRGHRGTGFIAAMQLTSLSNKKEN